MIKPTIGRVVWYKNDDEYIKAHNDPAQPLAAIITYVHDDRLVNLAVFDMYGVAISRTLVPLLQDDDKEPGIHYCMWMPYQKGQAAKTEQLEATIKSSENEQAKK
jgi:hypothetical protein